MKKNNHKHYNQKLSETEKYDSSEASNLHILLARQKNLIVRDENPKLKWNQTAENKI